VDNQHTQTFPFWEWCIGELKDEKSRSDFFAEAFTVQKVMYRLAKTWVHAKRQLFSVAQFQGPNSKVIQHELTPRRRRNFCARTLPNTRTSHAFLQTDGAPTFAIRCVLASDAGARVTAFMVRRSSCGNMCSANGSEDISIPKNTRLSNGIYLRAQS